MIPQEWIDKNMLFETKDHAQKALDKDYSGYRVAVFEGGDTIIVNEKLEIVCTIRNGE